MFSCPLNYKFGFDKAEIILFFFSLQLLELSLFMLFIPHLTQKGSIYFDWLHNSHSEDILDWPIFSIYHAE